MVSWEQEQELFDPIVLQGRTPLLTLRDVAHYITKLPKAEHDAEERRPRCRRFQVAEHGGPTMFARIGVMRAVNRHVERAFDMSRKDERWVTRKLKRDQ
jgi:hypothetical protein